MTSKKGEYPFSRDTFLEWRNPRFGTDNPSQFHSPVWHYLAKTQEYSGEADEIFGIESTHEAGPCWCNSRYGQSITELDDGRTIYIGGEHEDYYHSQFNIYNDVIVKTAEGKWHVFSYPKAIFPPTDSHTATLHGNSIIIIGSIGYQNERRFGEIDVFSLDLDSYAIERLVTTGDCPGWVNRHDAWLLNDGYTIQVLNGIVETETEYYENHVIFHLDLSTLNWQKIRTQTPSSFSIFYKRDQTLNKYFENLDGIDDLPFPTHQCAKDFLDNISFLIGDTKVSIKDNYDSIKVSLSDILPEVQLCEVKKHFINKIATISTDKPEITDKQSELYLTSVQIEKTTFELPILVFNIDEFEELDSIRGLSCERFNLLQINRKDFGALNQQNGVQQDWRVWIEETMRHQGMEYPDDIGKIELACTPKVLGCRVNPIAVWYVYFESSDALCAVIIEHNDTKGNRHHYVIHDNVWLSKIQGNTNVHGTLPNCDVNIDEYGISYKLTHKKTVNYQANGEVRALLGKNLFKPFGNMKNIFKIIKRMIFFVLMPTTKKHSQSGIALHSK